MKWEAIRTAFCGAISRFPEFLILNKGDIGEYPAEAGSIHGPCGLLFDDWVYFAA